MSTAHRISDGLFDFLYKAITTRHHWIAYKSEPRFLQQGDIHCFGSREEAMAFKEKESCNDKLFLIYAPSILSIYRQIEASHSISILSTLKTNIMNEQNYEYLKDSLKYLGFGESLSNPLHEAMSKGRPDFQLTFETEMNKKAFAAVINFRKSDNTDMYFVNSYHAVNSGGLEVWHHYCFL